MKLENKTEKPYYEFVSAYDLTPEELIRASNLDNFVSEMCTVGYDENGETFIAYFLDLPNESGPNLFLYKDTSSEPITGLEESAQRIAQQIKGRVEPYEYGFRVIIPQKISQKDFATKYVDVFKQVFDKVIGEGCLVVFYKNVSKEELKKSGLPRKKLKNLHTLVK